MKQQLVTAALSCAFSPLAFLPSLAAQSDPVPTETAAPTRVSFINPRLLDNPTGMPAPGDLSLNVLGEPVLGGAVEVTLETASSPQAVAMMLGFDAVQQFWPNGTILLVDPMTAAMANVTLSGGSATVSAPVPNDPALNGLWALTQFIAIDGNDLLSSDAAAMRIGNTPEFGSFAFQSVSYSNYLHVYDDAPNFGTTTLNGSLAVTPDYKLDGTVTIQFASGASGTLTCQSYDGGTDMAVQFGSATLAVHNGEVYWNGTAIGHNDDLIYNAMLGIDQPEAVWSDLTRAIVGWGHVISSPQYNHNDRVAQRMARTYGLVGALRDPCAASIFATKAWLGKKAVQLCAELMKLCNANGGKHFCVQSQTGQVHYWIELSKADCLLLDTLCTIGGAVIIYEIGAWMEARWTTS